MQLNKKVETVTSTENILRNTFLLKQKQPRVSRHSKSFVTVYVILHSCQVLAYCCREKVC